MRFLVTLLFLLPSLLLPGQQELCNGTLGENIFTDGDFGSGPDFIFPTDPGIAPGYVYVTIPPPDDGMYCLTNNMALWSSIYSAWVSRGDNSNDPQGYMMVVNADYTPGVFYLQTVDGLCENTRYQFSADIINLYRRNEVGAILPNVSFHINQQEQFTTGNIENDEQWHTFGFTFTTGAGETSVELALVNNAPGGIGNDLAIDNITFRPCGPMVIFENPERLYVCEGVEPEQMQVIVEGDPGATYAYQWQLSHDKGMTWTNVPGANGPVFQHTILLVGEFHYRVLVAGNTSNLQNSKCRVVSPVKIVEIVQREFAERDSVCTGLEYEFGDELLTESGIYSGYFTSVHGCDSIVTLELTFVPDQGIDADITPMPPTCHNTDDGTIIIDNLVNFHPPFYLEITNEEEEVLNSLVDFAAGDYLIRIEDRYGCSFEEWVTVEAPPPFTIDLGPDIGLDIGEEAIIHVDANAGIASYAWFPEGLVTCDVLCDEVSLVPSEEMYVWLEAVSSLGCVDVDSVFLRIDPVPRLFVPNVFSPNGDGVNDKFFISGFQSGILEVAELGVFDRWGNVIFHTTGAALNDKDSGWNGTTADGSRAMPGVYNWLVRVHTISGSLYTTAGSVTLVR